jgi:4-hydroxy-tetrahydrodipicolinate synthase
MLELKGLVPALTTPFTEDGGLDLPAFRRLIDDIVDDGVHGVLVSGCTGESWALEETERLELFRAAVAQVDARVPVVAGCGAVTARHAIARVKQAETAGCDAVMIQPPWYVLPNEDEILDYYLRIIQSTELPIVVYNIPRRTGVSLSVDLVDRLADEPTVIALKESSKDFILLSQMIRRVSDRVSVLAGYASLFGLAAITVGAVGYIDSATPVLGKRSREFYDAVLSGDLTRARLMQGQMAILNAFLFGAGTFPAGVKAALDILGRPGGWPREPIKPLTGEQKETLRSVLREIQLLPVQDG